MEAVVHGVCVRCRRPMDDHQWYAVVRSGDGWGTDWIAIDPPKCPKTIKRLTP